MKRAGLLVGAAIVAAQGLLGAQAGDVNKILADARAAIGEKKLAALRSFSATGQATRVTGDTSSAPTDVELAFELPDKYMRKDVLAQVMNTTITRTSGFNADNPINIIDQPPAGPGMIVIRAGSGGPPPGVPPTPEQEQEQRKRTLLSARQDFARLTLGFLLASPPAYPLQFAYGGQAESPDGTADIVDVTGEGDFKVRLFIDTKTHLPLMLSWMAKEPLVMRSFGGPGGAVMTGSAGGTVTGNRTVTYGGGSGQVATADTPGKKPGTPPEGQVKQTPTPEDRDKMMKQLEEQRKEAEAKLRTVEYRIYYGDYQDADGVKVPRRIQRSIDGKPTEETVFDKVKINGKIDPKKFDAGK